MTRWIIETQSNGTIPPASAASQRETIMPRCKMGMDANGLSRHRTAACTGMVTSVRSRIAKAIWDNGVRTAVDRHQGCRRSEEHTSELQSLMRISYDVFCLKKKKHIKPA